MPVGFVFLFIVEISMLNFFLARHIVEFVYVDNCILSHCSPVSNYVRVIIPPGCTLPPPRANDHE